MISGTTRIQPLLHDSYDAEHFVAQCKRELQQYPRQPLPRPEPHPAVMDETTPALLRRQAA